MGSQFRAQDCGLGVGVGERLDVGRFLRADAIDNFAVAEGLLAAIFDYDAAGDFDDAVGEAGYGFVFGHTGPCCVAIDVFDLPVLLLHPASAADYADNGAGGGGVVVGVPAEIERVRERLDEVTLSIKQCGDGGGGAEFAAVLVAGPVFVEGVFIFDEAAGRAPIIRILFVPGTHIGDDSADEAIGVDGGSASIKDFIDIICRESGGNH